MLEVKWKEDKLIKEREKNKKGPFCHKSAPNCNKMDLINAKRKWKKEKLKIIIILIIINKKIRKYIFGVKVLRRNKQKKKVSSRSLLCIIKRKRKKLKDEKKYIYTI